MNASPPSPTPGPPAEAAPAPAVDSYPWGLYLHVIVVSFIGGFAVLGWFLLYEALNKLIWDNAFVSGHTWVFPVICLPFSLLYDIIGFRKYKFVGFFRALRYLPAIPDGRKRRKAHFRVSDREVIKKISR